MFNIEYNISVIAMLNFLCSSQIFNVGVYEQLYRNEFNVTHRLD